jgi:hypothetical protein
LTNFDWSVRRSDETTVALGLRTMQSLSPRDVEGGGLASQDQEPATCHRRRRRRVIDMAPSSRQLQACSIHELQNLYEAQETAIHNMTSHLNKITSRIKIEVIMEDGRPGEKVTRARHRHRTIPGTLDGRRPTEG